MQNGEESAGNAPGDSPRTTKFSPTDRTKSTPDVNLPDELWLTVLESPCTFPPDIYHEVMLNMLKNPNVTSSHLFRADIFYDSGEHDDHGRHDSSHGLLKHLKADYRPIRYDLPGYRRTRTMVRQLIPRNPQLDRPLMQTCHFFQQLEDDAETNIVLYIPHVQCAEEMPFYHPTVSKLAFVHNWRRAPPASNTHKPQSEAPIFSGTTSVSYCLFQQSLSLSTKLQRTALRLLATVHKHGQGQLAGYEKRVHLDRMIPQKRYQDTYTRLKAKYGRRLAEQWVEATDPGKHVFEDLGIAAFLIELWRDTYAEPGEEVGDGMEAKFPGFVDIGCGNGILTYVLLSEGYEGWGFDARRRKTWSIFPLGVQKRLQQRLLVPEIFMLAICRDEFKGKQDPSWHDGIFDNTPGAFIISNHADELTAWTPLIAYLNHSSFIAIPCCSHDLAGSRFRAPPSTKAARAKSDAAAPTERLPQQQRSPQTSQPDAAADGVGAMTKRQAPETGSLRRTPEQKKMPSAYSTLCSYVGSLAEEVGFVPEQEVLRIPSTRNLCIVGRRKQPDHTCTAGDAAAGDATTRRMKVALIVESELGKTVAAVGKEWIARAEKLAKKPGSGH